MVNVTVAESQGHRPVVHLDLSNEMGKNNLSQELTIYFPPPTNLGPKPESPTSLILLISSYLVYVTHTVLSTIIQQRTQQKTKS